MSNRAFDIELPGVPVPLSPTQAVTYLGEQGKSPRTIHKLLKGQMSYGAVRSAMWRARQQGRDVPTWRGGIRGEAG
jgi:hypothetical protein